MSHDGLRADGPAVGREQDCDRARRNDLEIASVPGIEEEPAAGAAALDDVAVHRVWLSGGLDAAVGGRSAMDLITGEGFHEEERELLRLMISELVANSVVHGGAIGAGDLIQLLITVRPGMLRVECSDPCGGFDAPAELPYDARRPGGYGLQIIDELADDWGTRLGRSGSTWFEYARGRWTDR
jgi:anti-sigma regulatory factor (Ser/Thr protein kinase)